MRNLKLYETASGFTEEEGNELIITSATPGAGYILETKETKFNNHVVSIITVYKVTDGGSQTRIYYENTIKTGLKDVIIDGVTYQPGEVTKMWNFPSGRHSIRWRYTELTTIPNSAFRGCTTLTYVNVPKTVSLINDGAFRECTSLKTVVLNYEGIVTMNAPSVREPWPLAFYDCRTIETFKVPEQYVYEYKKMSGTRYGAAAIVPIGKRILTKDYGDPLIGYWAVKGQGSLTNQIVIEAYDKSLYREEDREIIPALTDYIEIPEYTSAVSFNSGNLYYYSPYNGAYRSLKVLLYDENKNIIDSATTCFCKSSEENSIDLTSLPLRAKYMRYTILWDTIPSGKWAKYAHVMDLDTGEVIYPKITYA